MRRRRCLIPATGFYEWKSVEPEPTQLALDFEAPADVRATANFIKHPYYVHARGSALMAIAGLWECWNSPGGEVLETCTVLTTEPNSLLADIYVRMPAILEPPDYSRWLGDDGDPSELLRPAPDSLLDAYRVSTAINNPRFDDERAIVGIAEG